MEVKRAWFVLASQQRLGPFSSWEVAEEEAYRVGGAEIEERFTPESCSNTRVEVAVIHHFALHDATPQPDRS